MAASRRPSAAQLRQRRARIAAIVLGVAFLGVAVIQGPKLLKAISGGSSSSTTAASTTTATTPGAVGATTTPATASGATVSGAGTSQLNNFSLFNPVVPFKPIPKPASASSTTTTAAGKAAAAPKAAATTTTAASTPAPAKAATPAAATTTAPTPAGTTPTPPAPPVTFTVPNGITAAIVKVNGKKELYGAGATFPEEAPLFKLAAIAKKGLKISVLGGTFIDGQRYLVLRQGNEVTLLNQSDGTKFVIVYLKKMTVPANELTSPTQTAATATTPAAPATTVAAPPATTAAG